MEYSKILLVILYSALFFTEAYTQKISIKTGFNLYKNRLIAKPSFYEDIVFLPGFHIGGTAEFLISESSISERIIFESGLIFSEKGSRYHFPVNLSRASYKIDRKVSIFYLEIPFFAKAYLTTGKTRFYTAFGTYLGLGLISFITDKYLEVEGPPAYKTRNTDVGLWNNYKRLDYGLYIEYGVETGDIRIGCSHAFGLLNISKSSTKKRNRVFSLFIAHMFNRKIRNEKYKR